MKKQILFLLLSCFLFATNYSYSQSVGINTDNPSVLTELEIKNIVNGTDTIPKGIMIPRLTQKLRDQIDTSVATAVNSLMIYNTDEDCYNYFSRANNEWQSLCGKLGKAQFTIPDCDKIVVGGKGTYFSDKALNASHYLEVTVDVTKAGSYTITGMAKMETDGSANGYYYTLSGEFLTTGTYTLIVPGAGTPLNPSPNQDDLTTGDKIAITLNGEDSGCDNVRVHIIDSTIKPVFTMNCGAGRATGIYKIGVNLDTNNTISMVINGDVSEGAGAKAVLQTNEVDGMKFISNPVEILGGPQTIILYGVGKPGSAGVKTFTITSNSTSSAMTCEIQLNVVMKPKKILSIAYGGGGVFGYNWGKRDYARGAYDMFKDTRNFGALPTSVVQIENLEIIRMEAGTITASQLNPYLDGPQKVDMVHLAYSTTWSAADQPAIAAALAKYVRNGNPFFLMADNNGGGVNGWTAIMQAIFEGVTSSVIVEDAQARATGRVYRLSSANHPILNGPFGDLRDKCWGEDASYGQVVRNLPIDEVIVFSGTYDISSPAYVPVANQQDAVTAFVHRKYPFIYVGDGGFNSNNNGTDATICPFKLDVSNYPIPKPNYGTGSVKHSVYNSAFVANAVAWGLNIVEGIAKQ